MKRYTVEYIDLSLRGDTYEALETYLNNVDGDVVSVMESDSMIFTVIVDHGRPVSKTKASHES